VFVILVIGGEVRTVRFPYVALLVKNMVNVLMDSVCAVRAGEAVIAPRLIAHQLVSTLFHVTVMVHAMKSRAVCVIRVTVELIALRGFAH
jgi:hypothetical protein